MLNEERIRLMTKMAAFEEGEGKEYVMVKRYYRRDYIGYQMIRTFISSTIAFGILALLGILYSADHLVDNLVKMDLVQLGILSLTGYVAFVLIYQVIAFWVYTKKYNRATAQMKLYHSRLKRVARLQEREENMQLEE